MTRALIFVVIAGLLIGLALPPDDDAPAAADVAKSPRRQETVLERKSNGHFYTYAKLNDAELVHFVVDTGATVVALTIDDARASESRWIRPSLRLSPRVQADLSAARN